MFVWTEHSTDFNYIYLYIYNPYTHIGKAFIVCVCVYVFPVTTLRCVAGICIPTYDEQNQCIQFIIFFCMSSWIHRTVTSWLAMCATYKNEHRGIFSASCIRTVLYRYGNIGCLRRSKKKMVMKFSKECGMWYIYVIESLFFRCTFVQIL